MITPTPQAIGPEQLELLSQLRDIRLPDAVSWWPLASGWWILFTGVLVILSALVLYRAWHRRTMKYLALQEIDKIRQQYSDDNASTELAEQLSVLLKRVAVTLKDNKNIVNAHGNAWAAYLSAEPGGIAHPLAQFIATAPYMSLVAYGNDPTIQAARSSALIDAVQSWIRRHA